ncbi:MAG: hypothetical protein KJN92_10775, partial [Gemmatimonadetes bacterium]|nr:hypothetical protein [Gemmatimonadota bacterium]
YALFFLLSGRWKAFFATVLTVSGLFAAYSIRGSLLDFPIYFQIIARENVIHWGALPSGISIASLVSPLFLDSIHTKAPFPNEQLGLAIHQGVLLVGLFLFSIHARKLVSAGKTQLGFVLTGLYMILISPISWPHIAPFLVFSGVVISQAAHQQEGWTAKWLVPLGLSFLVLLPPHDAIFELLTRLSGGGPPDDRSLLLVLAKPGMYATLAQLAIVTWIGSQSPSKDESGSGSMLPTPGERQDIPG